jgi:hypothetical protein
MQPPRQWLMLTSYHGVKSRIAANAPIYVGVMLSAVFAQMLMERMPPILSESLPRDGWFVLQALVSATVLGVLFVVVTLLSRILQVLREDAISERSDDDSGFGNEGNIRDGDVSDGDTPRRRGD